MRGLHTAQELEKYYERRGNRHIFRNGMNQNSLSDYMAEIGGADFDQGSLSKAVSGNRPFTDWQIEVFCEALPLSQSEKWSLTFAVARDRCVEKGLTIELSASPPTLTLVMANLERIEQVQRLGYLPLAINMLYDLYTWQAELDAVSPAPPVLRVLSCVQNQRQQILQAVQASQYPQGGSPLQVTSRSTEGAESQDILVFLPENQQLLTPLEREAWTMYQADNLSVEEIANVLSREEATIHSLLHAVRQKLVAHYTDGDETGDLQN